MTMEDANSSFLSSAAKEGPKLCVSQTFQEPYNKKEIIQYTRTSTNDLHAAAENRARRNS